MIKNEDWLARGVKNVIGLPRPVPFEIDLQQATWFLNFVNQFGFDPVTTSSVFVKLGYFLLFAVVLVCIFIMAQLALNSPWGRMMRAIRDNEVSAKAMGKHIKKRHLEIFVIGSGICGIAGAMMTTLDGQFTPGAYQPLRFTFLIWVMVIVGGAGSNLGAVIGGFIIWFFLGSSGTNWTMVDAARYRRSARWFRVEGSFIKFCGTYAFIDYGTDLITST